MKNEEDYIENLWRSINTADFDLQLYEFGAYDENEEEIEEADEDVGDVEEIDEDTEEIENIVEDEEE